MIAYSFGISDDVSWDLDMARRGYDIFMYDPTIDALPLSNDKFHFFKEGIFGIEVKEKSLNTLENFIKRNGHENKSNMILKMDVEGAEWSFLSTVSSKTLSQFDQMTFEFHKMILSKSKERIMLVFNCFSKIIQTHSLVHAHANNYGGFIILDDNNLFPNNLELTFVRNSNYNLVDDDNIYLPIPLDQPCKSNARDIPLGYWNKKFNNVVKNV